MSFEKGKKQDYACSFCSEQSKDVMVLSKCFHIICSVHFDGLSRCPKCNISLEGCNINKDDGLQTAIDSCQKISNNALVEPSSSKRMCTKHETVSETSPELNEENNPGTSNTVSVTATTKLNEPTKVNENQYTSILPFTRSNMKKPINRFGETHLHIACRFGRAKSILQLLQGGANTNIKDDAGWTPLHRVVQIGRLDLVQLLLKYNALIDVPGWRNKTPLHEAMMYNDRDIAVELVKNGADIKARNSKGETPLILASDDIKEELKKAEQNRIQSHSNAVLFLCESISKIDNIYIRVHCVSTHYNIHKKLKLLAEHHSNVHIEEKFTKEVTHLIVDTENNVCESNYDVLQGIVNSVWILSTNWITKSTVEKLQSFQHYEVLGVGTNIYKGPRNARYNKYKLLPPLFNGCHFYLHYIYGYFEVSETLFLAKGLLAKLIKDAGGVILTSAPNPEWIPVTERVVPYHAKENSKLFNCSHYIIFEDMYEPMYDLPHLKALPVGWLVKCIEKYELCEP